MSVCPTDSREDLSSRRTDFVKFYIGELWEGCVDPYLFKVVQK